MKDFHKEEIVRSERTRRFLLCISRHLSSRKECRKKNYTVLICPDAVFFDPYIKVYPSRYHRKKESSVGIIEHVVLGHFYHSVYSHTDDSGTIFVQKDSLVPGRYIYQSSLDNKRRRWNKID